MIVGIERRTLTPKARYQCLDGVGYDALIEHGSPYEDSYRLALVAPETRRILTYRCKGIEQQHGLVDELYPSLPRISVPRWSRAVAHIQSQIRERWNVRAALLDIAEAPAAGELIAIAEMLNPPPQSPVLIGMEWAALGAFGHMELRSIPDPMPWTLQDLLENRCMQHRPFLRVGWTEDLLAWISSVVPAGRSFGSVQIEQLNASGTRTLVKVRRGESLAYWFKAAAGSGDTEFAKTLLLSRSFPQFLPSTLAVRDEWGGWLMEDSGCSLEDTPVRALHAAEKIGTSLAMLQRASAGVAGELLHSGFTDYRMPSLQSNVAELRPNFELAIAVQRGSCIPEISRSKLSWIVNRFAEISRNVQEIGLPDTLVHPDLNPANILVSRQGCVFIDWENAAVGNPLIAFNQLRSYFNQNPSLRPAVNVVTQAYCRLWLADLSKREIAILLKSSRLLAIAADLSNRKQWIMSEYQHNMSVQRYLRSTLRQMEFVVQSLKAPPYWPSDCAVTTW